MLSPLLLLFVRLRVCVTLVIEVIKKDKYELNWKDHAKNESLSLVSCSCLKHYRSAPSRLFATKLLACLHSAQGKPPSFILPSVSQPYSSEPSGLDVANSNVLCLTQLQRRDCSATWPQCLWLPTAFFLIMAAYLQ